MRRPKLSSKKYIFFILTCALLLIVGIRVREYEIGKIKNPPKPLHAGTQDGKAQKSVPPYTHSNITSESHNREAALEAVVSTEESDGVDTVLAEDGVADVIKTPSLPVDAANSAQSEQELQQQHFLDQALLEGNGTRPYYFHQGEYYPKPAVPSRDIKRGKSSGRRGKKQNMLGARLFPYQNPHSDRLVNQLMYVPPNYEEVRASGRLKTILLYNGLDKWDAKLGRDVFLSTKCPVDTCEVTTNRDLADKADMIMYKDHFIPTGLDKPSNPRQVSLMYYLESPYHTQKVQTPNAINWTATYRRDSDIMAPYDKWHYYDTKIKQIEQDHNYALNKTKKVAWFVSNCAARNNRLQFARELQKYIDVDIYGACGNQKCPRNNADKCFELLDKDYKFYLAFENSNCKDYITEKFFNNALKHNILPIVMGARPEDYEVSAPYHSYIHVDEFGSAKELAEYLHILDKDDELYNSYFKWKGTGDFVNTFYWCRVCALLHDEESLRRPRWYTDVNDWWRGDGICRQGSWRN
ncbi:glycoprotein 3-alpha-L-fucosyltransferase A [Ceratitis capitata]|nr:glycoprotein 3-alpha-L-fucosyltransferase A [Ceratitis capitata]